MSVSIRHHGHAAFASAFAATADAVAAFDAMFDAYVDDAGYDHTPFTDDELRAAFGGDAFLS